MKEKFLFLLKKQLVNILSGVFESVYAAVHARCIGD